MNASLRTKGILAVMVLLAYLALISVFLTRERQKLVVIVDHMETTQIHQAVLAPIVSMLSHAIVETHVLLNSPAGVPVRADNYGDLPDEFDAISSGLSEAVKLYPALEPEVRAYGMAAASMRAAPDRQYLKRLGELEQPLLIKLTGLVNELDARGKELSLRYRDTQQYITTFAITANIVGAVASIAVIIVFFTRLAKDIERLQDRAVAIVGGYSGEPLKNTRKDEVGGLINAVNRMQGDLRRWEQQLEVARQQRSHHEKMAAVGSLAAAISHEVSNPIAAIAGVAQFIVDETKRDDQRSNKTVNEFAAQILTQTERIARIMRKMATLTTPHPPEAELLDVNALIQSTCGFMGYDNRFRGIEFEFDLGHDVPAITAVADHITQVLTNLLINAADAMDAGAAPGKRRIRIATRTVADGVQVSVTDNGRGMSPEILAKAFEESFTTKAAGGGRGIGLFVCKSLIEEGGGRIGLQSKVGEGTTVNLVLPLRPPERAAG
jgi:two-component system NtrC family sensor kinase